MGFMNFGGQMKNIATIKAKDKVDYLKYAYAFMKTQKLNIKECSFVNPHPTQFSSTHLMPRDMYSASYTDNVPSWEDFKSNETHISSIGFHCAGCVDTKDRKRVLLVSLEDNIMYNCYGNYEHEAKVAFDDILSIYSTLK